MVMGFLAGLAAGAIAGGLFGRKKKKKQPEQQLVQPELRSPFLSEQQIKQNPILSSLYGRWQQLQQSVAAPQLPPELLQRLTQTAMATPDIQGAVSTVSGMMRPLFEEQLGRQLQFTREQLASTLGTPTGGALAEVMRRQMQEAERGWMAQLGQLGFQELQAQREMQRWATGALPSLLQWQTQAQFMPMALLAQAATPFMGTFVSPQVIQPTYQPSFLEQLLPAVPLLAGL